MRVMAELTTTRPTSKVEFTKAESAAPAAVQAFWDVLSERGAGALDDADAGARAADLVLLERATAWWEDLVGPLLTADQVADLLHYPNTDHVPDHADYVRDLARQGQLLVVQIGPDNRGHQRFPLSQFDAQHQPWRILPQLLELLHRTDMRDESIAGWLHVPHIKNELGGLSCEQWLREGRDPSVIVEVARRTVHDLSL